MLKRIMFLKFLLIVLGVHGKAHTRAINIYVHWNDYLNQDIWR